jgi:hypothetical protein
VNRIIVIISDLINFSYHSSSRGGSSSIGNGSITIGNSSSSIGNNSSSIGIISTGNTTEISHLSQFNTQSCHVISAIADCI